MTDRTHMHRATRERGFSLVELMVVLVILAVGILPIAYVQTRAQQSVFDSGRETEALGVAQTIMETARSQGFGTVVDGAGDVGTYQWTRTVQTVSFGLQQISVTVNWNERGRPRSVTVVNLLSMR